MNCIQVTACQRAFNVSNIYHSRCGPFMPRIAPADVFQLHKNSLKLTTFSSIYQCTRLPKTCLRPTTGASSYRQCAPVCLFGGKGKSENGNEASPWKDLDKAMESLNNELSLEEELRQQINEEEYYDDGGSDGNRPGGGGGGGDPFGESEFESLEEYLDEVLQVILAAIGLVFLYIFILEGETITAYTKDYIKFLLRGQQSNRVKRLTYQLGELYQWLTAKKVYHRKPKPYWLEIAIANTPTWWDSPSKYKDLATSYLARRLNE